MAEPTKTDQVEAAKRFHEELLVLGVDDLSVLDILDTLAMAGLRFENDEAGGPERAYMEIVSGAQEAKRA